MGPEPLYRQVADILRSRIESGRYPVRRALPSGPKLAEEFGVSWPTIRSALGVLKGEGLVQGVKGKGVYVMAREQVGQTPLPSGDDPGQPGG